MLQVKKYRLIYKDNMVNNFKVIENHYFLRNTTLFKEKKDAQTRGNSRKIQNWGFCKLIGE